MKRDGTCYRSEVVVSTGDGSRWFQRFSLCGDSFDGEMSHSGDCQSRLAVPLCPGQSSYWKLLFRFDLLCVLLNSYSRRLVLCGRDGDSYKMKRPIKTRCREKGGGLMS